MDKIVEEEFVIEEEEFVVEEEEEFVIEEEVIESPKGKKTKVQLFLEHIQYDDLKGESIVVDISLIPSELKFGNGASWARMDSTFARQYRYVTRKTSGELLYSWDATDDEKFYVENDFNHILKRKGKAVSHIKVYGKKIETQNSSRSIRKDIRDYFKGQGCVSCGSNHNIEIDHKNGLYNDPRVSSIGSQRIEDFQVLCRHCNLQKRQTIRETKLTGHRYGATRIPMLSPLGVDFTIGDYSYDKKDIDAMVGTYWYDPVDFIRKVKMNLIK
jgi:5-methylcytosine-specific restriction endonuclease McrA